MFFHVCNQRLKKFTDKNIKKYGSASVIVGVGISEGTQLAKDGISSKLKAYGYQSLFAITPGPVIQFVSLPFYVYCSLVQFLAYTFLIKANFNKMWTIEFDAYRFLLKSETH